MCIDKLKKYYKRKKKNKWARNEHDISNKTNENVNKYPHFSVFKSLDTLQIKLIQEINLSLWWNKEEKKIHSQVYDGKIKF